MKDYVTYEEHKQLKDYVDDLVSKIPFLPKDIDNLREANLTFATENHILRQSISTEEEIEILSRIIPYSRDKYTDTSALLIRTIQETHRIILERLDENQRQKND